MGDSLTTRIKMQLLLSISASVAGSCCIFTLAVRQPPVLASCIEIYYSQILTVTNFQKPVTDKRRAIVFNFVTLTNMFKFYTLYTLVDSH